MTPPDLISTLAGALLSALFSEARLGSRVADLLKGDIHKKALTEAIESALEPIQQTRSDLTSAFFDEIFLTKEAVPILTQSLAESKDAAANSLLEAWETHRGGHMQVTDKAEVLAVFRKFLEDFEEALRGKDAYNAIFEALDRQEIRKNTARSADAAEQLIEEFTSLRHDMQSILPVGGLETERDKAGLEAYGPPLDVALLPNPAQFVGRREEVEWLSTRLQTTTGSKVVALWGMAGLGRSAIVGEAIRQLMGSGAIRDGIAVIQCSGIHYPNQLIQVVLSRFDPQRRMPNSEDRATLSDIALRLLGGKNAIIVLDDVESDLPLSTVTSVLKHLGPMIAITCRHMPSRLAAPRQSTLCLRPLSSSDAMQLFAVSLGRMDSEPLTEAEKGAAQRIIDIVEGHTLAVIMAAGYTEDYGQSLNEVAEKLSSPPGLLALPVDEMPQGFAQILGHSYEKLTAEAQIAFAAIGVFSKPDFGYVAALDLLRELSLTNAEAALEELHRLALIQLYTADDMPEGLEQRRCRLHSLVAAYSTYRFEHLDDKARNDAHFAIAKYYSRYAYNTPDELLSRDEHNILKALDWAHHSARNPFLVASLCWGMHTFWRDYRRIEVGLTYLPWGASAARAIAERAKEGQEIKVIANQELSYEQIAGTLSLTFGEILENAGRIDESKRVLEHVLQIGLNEGDVWLQAQALVNLGDIATYQADYEEAELDLQTACALLHEHDVSQRPL